VPPPGITKPNQIIAESRKRDRPEPTIAQLRNYLQYQKAKESLKVLRELSQMYSTHSAPTALDEPHVVSTEFIREEGFGFPYPHNVCLISLRKRHQFTRMLLKNFYGNV